jgi:hypothetical protein
VGGPYCGPQLDAEHSIELGKQIYGGTRRWLDQNHPYHSEAMKCHFNGKSENRNRPRVVIVEEQMQRATKFEEWKSVGNREGALGDPSKQHGMKRLSTLCHLPYWKVSHRH